MNVTFWGTRGSIPTPGKEYIKYGGNTPCLEVTLGHEDRVLILDAGTGIRPLGLDLMKRLERIHIHLLLTHFHWDHLQGIPFFAPLYSEKCECTFIGYDVLEGNLKKRLQDSVCPPYFPVGFDVFKAEIGFEDRCEGEFTIGEMHIGVVNINHPNGAVGYRIKAGGKTCVYMTDNELNSMDPVYQKLVDFCEGADLLIHDAQYTPDEYTAKTGWGHSSYVDAVQFAIECDVKRLAHFHHDPEHDDTVVDRMVEKSRRMIQEKNSSIKCFGARESLEIEL